jgi:hypothetical protein
MERIHVYQILDGERDYQNDRWQKDIAAGKANYTEYEWLIFIQDYLTEAIRLATRGNEVDEARIAVQNSIRKITAMGVACMEQNGCPEREGYERLMGLLYHPRKMVFKIPVGNVSDDDIDAYIKNIAEKYRKNVTISGEDFALMTDDEDIFIQEKNCDCSNTWCDCHNDSYKDLLCKDDSCDCGDTQH